MAQDGSPESKKHDNPEALDRLKVITKPGETKIYVSSFPTKEQKVVILGVLAVLVVIVLIVVRVYRRRN